jgi:hypothetical protein
VVVLLINISHMSDGERQWLTDKISVLFSECVISVAIAFVAIQNAGQGFLWR